MAKRKDTEISSETATSPDKDKKLAQPAADEAKIDAQAELPLVESPPISPAEEKPAADRIAANVPAIIPFKESAGASAPPRRRFAFPEMKFPEIKFPELKIKISRRQKRNAMLAASVIFAAGLGAVIGALAIGHQAAPVQTSNSHERELQQSVVRLNKEITTLKANIATANKAAQSQIAKITDKLAEHGERPAPKTTGSVPPPPPRPAVTAAAPLARPLVVKDWAIRDARAGYVYVQGHGDIYQVVPGAPLPGLGPVQSITRQDGRWVVMTPKGIIVSMRDRRYFE